LYDGVYFVNRNREITYWNKGAERITGYKDQQVVGRCCRDNLLNHVTANGVQLCKDGCPLAACMKDGKAREADVFLHHADGHCVPVIVRTAPQFDPEGNIIGAVETFSSGMGLMSVRKELRELRKTAHTDKLTRIYNRRYLEGRLFGIIAQLEHQADTKAGILFIDIDYFKRFNDDYGHDVGDKALQMVGSTLRNSLRTSDVVGRWGGEEFLAIIGDVASLKELKAISEKVRTLVEASRLDLANASLTITISMGATLFTSTDTPESIVRRADRLMYQSKRAGRNQVSTG